MEEEIEEWRMIEGFEKYEVSSFGRVRSYWRKEVKILSLLAISKGYCRISVYKEHFTKPRSLYVHQLVSIAFLGHKIGIKDRIINHIDENTLNNRANNLEIVTARENTQKYHANRKALPIGVSKIGKEKWSARIRTENSTKRLGVFPSEKLANQACAYAIENPEKAGKIGVHEIGGHYQVIVAFRDGKRKIGLFSTKEEADFIFEKKKDLFVNRINGVRQRHGKYIVDIKINGKNKHIGTFNTEEEARQACLKAKQLYAQGKSD